MLVVISPAKRMDFSGSPLLSEFSKPIFIDESILIMNRMKKMSIKQIGNLMNLSNELAEINYERFQNWEPEFSIDNSRQAIFSFTGDVYAGLDARSFSKEELKFAQNHLRILSGLHGVLRPLDLIRPYRLEMGSKIKIRNSKNLYDFWGMKITDQIKCDLENNDDSVLINLASNEYFKSIKIKSLDVRIVTPVFKDFKNGEYKIIQFWAKKARGLMSSFIIRNKLMEVEQIKLFDQEGYQYNDGLSSMDEWVFTRG